MTTEGSPNDLVAKANANNGDSASLVDLTDVVDGPKNPLIIIERVVFYLPKYLLSAMFRSH
jgi:hypothetical protein